MSEKQVQEFEIKPEDVKTIYQAINAVMNQVGYVRKQKGSGLNYTYAGEAAFIAAVRPWLVTYGIVITPEVVSEVETREYSTKNGTQMTNVAMTIQYRWTHAPSNTFTIVSARGEGSDSGDKAINKASTGSYKYGLRQALVIETGDDPDNTASLSQERSTSMSAPVKTATLASTPIILTKTLDDLVIYAGPYGMNEEAVREALRNAGHKSWSQGNYSEYQKVIVAAAPSSK